VEGKPKPWKYPEGTKVSFDESVLNDFNYNFVRFKNEVFTVKFSHPTLKVVYLVFADGSLHGWEQISHLKEVP
jgi:hypothetical protein